MLGRRHPAFSRGTLLVVNLPPCTSAWAFRARPCWDRSCSASACMDGRWPISPTSCSWAALSGLGWVTMGAAAVNALISPWFVARRPAALAMAYNGASIGGVIFSSAWVYLIDRIGFTQAALGEAWCR